jgi:outer membrane protein OmpA-like peptidoglycan-associated protein
MDGDGHIPWRYHAPGIHSDVGDRPQNPNSDQTPTRALGIAPIKLEARRQRANCLSGGVVVLNKKTAPFAALGTLVAALILAGCAHTTKPIILDSDVSFKFGSADLTPAGQKQIDMYVPSLMARGEIRLDIIGHTDRIGSDAANLALSKRRAEAVRSQLLKSGKLKSDQITTRGVGPRNPVVNCPQQSQDALIKCLGPNRRVEINVTELRW